MSAEAAEPEATRPEVKIEEATVKESDAAAQEPQEPHASNPATPTAPTATIASGLNKQELEILDKILKRMSEAKDPEDDERELSGAFQRMLNKRNFADYFLLIKNPIAFSTIRSKILKKQYANYQQFIKDFAYVFHNAYVYNRPSAQVYKDAIRLEEIFKKELDKLVEDKILTREEAVLPYIGEIPEVEPSPEREPSPPEESEKEEEEDSDDDEEDEGTDDDRPRGRRNKRGRRSSAAVKRESKADKEDRDDPDAQKKRGRPPKVHTPMEARINNILKNLRKFKNSAGELEVLHFEKLPDKALMPEYYQEIKQPIAMDLIKKKAKRKNYQSVDQVLRDLNLMFENAKSYNLDTSQVFKDAVHLQREAQIIAEQEKQKPDSEYADEDGRLPLSEILYNGELWKVGDWVHLANPNDVTKPIVAQVYRTWQDTTGQKWINACWYYRPEQTVHRYEKHFFEHEVVKTGQYRDHKVEEIVDRCFVMFFTRFNKGRPRGFPADKEVYVCEARYNEIQYKLNKIKTWASCVPDEVREKDYEMDLFDVPRTAKKVPSPIKHLLREDASEDDPLPKPTWGAPNAPPIVGAVHKRPREANESPPPEPTPSPTPPPPPEPEPARRPVISDQPRYSSQGDGSMARSHSTTTQPSPLARHTPAPVQYGQQFPTARPSPSPAPLARQSSYGSGHQPASYTPQQYPQAGYTSQTYTSGATPVAQHAAISNYGSGYAGNPVRVVAPTQSSHMPHSNAYNPPRAVEVYTLPSSANQAIPRDIRSQFQQDEFGNVIFFTTPPLEANPLPEGKPKLSHSLRYLADKARAKEAEDKKRKAREADLEAEANDNAKRTKADQENFKSLLIRQKLAALETWTRYMEGGTDNLYEQLHGEKWKEVRDADLARIAAQQEEAFKKAKRLEKFQKESKEQREVKLTGFKWV